MSSFKPWFVLVILRFQKWFEVDVFGFQIEHWCRYFGIFDRATVFGYFFQKFGKLFFLSSGHIIQGAKERFSNFSCEWHFRQWHFRQCECCSYKNFLVV
jgi:hypothetical protein